MIVDQAKRNCPTTETLCLVRGLRLKEVAKGRLGCTALSPKCCERWAFATGLQDDHVATAAPELYRHLVRAQAHQEPSL